MSIIKLINLLEIKPRQVQSGNLPVEYYTPTIKKYIEILTSQMKELGHVYYSYDSILFSNDKAYHKNGDVSLINSFGDVFYLQQIYEDLNYWEKTPFKKRNHSECFVLDVYGNIWVDDKAEEFIYNDKPLNEVQPRQLKPHGNIPLEYYTDEISKIVSELIPIMKDNNYKYISFVNRLNCISAYRQGSYKDINGQTEFVPSKTELSQYSTFGHVLNNGIYQIGNILEKLSNVEGSNKIVGFLLDVYGNIWIGDKYNQVVHKKQPINEGKQRGLLYHFTPFKGILGILKSNVLKVGDDSNFETGGNTGNVSLTRNKDLHYFSYKITLDGDKLSNNYKITPYQYDIEAGEAEESVNRDIKNISKYIISISYLLNDNDQLHDLKNLNKIIKLYPNIKFIYKNKEVNYDFVKNFITEFPKEISSSKFSKTFQYKGKTLILTQSEEKGKEWPYSYEYHTTVDGVIYYSWRSDLPIEDQIKIRPGMSTIKDLFNRILQRINKKQPINEVQPRAGMNYEKSYGECHSAEEFNEWNNDRFSPSPNRFLVNIETNKIIAAFTSGNVKAWSRLANINEYLYASVSFYGLGDIDPSLPESWEHPRVVRQLITKYHNKYK